MTNLGALTWLVSGRARGGRARLVGTAAGIALGAMLLLLVCAAYQGMTERSARAGLYSYVDGEQITVFDETWAEAASPLREQIETGARPAADEFVTLGTGYGGTVDRFRGHELLRVDVAVGADSTASMPGLDSLPAAGEYAASPALADLIDRFPDDELRDRYGAAAGTVGDAGLAGPDTLLVVVGHDPVELARLPSAVLSTGLETGVSFSSTAYLIISIVGGIAVLLPVVALIGVVTRLDQAARADRFTTLGLLGATPRRVAAMAALETAATGAVGAAAGVALFWASLPLAARISVEGSGFFVADLALGAGTVAGGAILIVAVTTLTAYVSALRGYREPGGASRERPERRPHPIRTLPLALGVIALLGCALASRYAHGFPPESVPPQAEAALRLVNLAIIPAFALTAIGLLLAGPVLLAWSSRLAAARAGRAEGVLALNRLSRRPAAAFRAVNGLVVALFVVTVFSVAATAQTSEEALGASVADGPNRLGAEAFIVHHSIPSNDEAGGAAEAGAGGRGADDAGHRPPPTSRIASRRRPGSSARTRSRSSMSRRPGGS